MPHAKSWGHAIKPKIPRTSHRDSRLSKARVALSVPAEEQQQVRALIAKLWGDSDA